MFVWGRKERGSAKKLRQGALWKEMVRVRGCLVKLCLLILKSDFTIHLTIQTFISKLTTKRVFEEWMTLNDLQQAVDSMAAMFVFTLQCKLTAWFQEGWSVKQLKQERIKKEAQFNFSCPKPIETRKNIWFSLHLIWF